MNSPQVNSRPVNCPPGEQSVLLIVVRWIVLRWNVFRWIVHKPIWRGSFISKNQTRCYQQQWWGMNSGDLSRNKKKQNRPSISICELSLTQWTHACRYQKSCKRSCKGHFRAKLQQLLLLLLLCHAISQCSFSETTRDMGITNTLLEVAMACRCALGVLLRFSLIRGSNPK